MSSVSIPKWTPKFEKGKHISMLVIASRNSGKSYLTRHLLLHYLRDKYQLYVIFCSNAEEREKYLDIIPTDLAFENYKPELVKTLFELNEKRAREGKRKMDILILFDDEVGSKLKNNDDLLQTFTRGRHNGVSCVFITQAYTLANSTWRNNSDLIIMGRNNSAQARKGLVDNILSGSIDVPDNLNEKRLFQQLMRSYATETGSFLLCDYRGGEAEMLFRYRAPDGLE